MVSLTARGRVSPVKLAIHLNIVKLVKMVNKEQRGAVRKNYLKGKEVLPNPKFLKQKNNFKN